MGYTPQRTVFRLKFADEKFDGLEVLARSVPIGDMMGMTKFADFKGKSSTDFSTEDLETVDELFTIFARALDSWNLEDEEGTPIPATKGGLYTQELDFVLDVILAWMNAVASVSTPLGKPSSSGDRSLEESIPMETL